MRCTIFLWIASIWLFGSGLGCAPAWHPQMLQGLPLVPGRYLTLYYGSPDFKPAQLSYRLEVFPLEQVQGLDPSLAARWFQEELAGALTDNGLALKVEDAQCTLSGTVSRFYLRGPTFRFLSGKSHASLQVAGVLRQGPEIVFAFQDQVQITLPINPRHQTDLESELMARRVIRGFANNLLNEMLLPPLAAQAASSPP
jgi:hypothetical protein